MPWSLISVTVLLPLLFWAAYHHYHDRHRPEPVMNLLVCLGLGVLAAWLNRGMYVALGWFDLRYDALALASDNLPGLFAYAVLAIGIGEEVAKMLPFVVIVVHFRSFDEPTDGIIYASFIAMGFALLENLHFARFLSPLEAIARGFAGPLVHMAFASIWGYHLGKAKIARGSLLRAASAWLAVTALIHGTYDFLVLGFGNAALLSGALVIVSIWLWRLGKLRYYASQPVAAASEANSEPAPNPR